MSKALQGITQTAVFKRTYTEAEIAAWGNGDVVATFPVGRGNIVLGVTISTTELDSDAAPTMSIDGGHTGWTDASGNITAASSNAMFNNYNFGRDATNIPWGLTFDGGTGQPLEYLDVEGDTNIVFTIEAGAATANPAGGTVVIAIQYVAYQAVN